MMTAASMAELMSSDYLVMQTLEQLSFHEKVHGFALNHHRQ
jgi:hypothetical protein